MANELGKLELAGEGVGTAFTVCAAGVVVIPVFTDEETLVEDEKELVFSETVFMASSWSTSPCSLLTFSTKAFRFANSS